MDFKQQSEVKSDSDNTSTTVNQDLNITDDILLQSTNDKPEEESIIDEEYSIEEEGDISEGPDEEVIIEEEDEILDTYPSDILYENRVQEGELYLSVFREEDEIIDRFVTVQSIQENDILIVDEDNNETLLFLDKDSNVILKSEEYSFDIINFERLVEVEDKDISTIFSEELFMEEMLPEIEIDVEEVKNKIYSIQEKKESFITEMISKLNAYNDDTKINKICDIAEVYIQIIQFDKIKEKDTSDVLSFLKETKTTLLPKWIIPIVDDIKKIYVEEEDTLEEHDDIIQYILYEELDKMQKIKDNEKNTYQTLSKSLNNFEPFTLKEQSIIQQHEGQYFRNCSPSEPCHGLNKNYTLELSKTRGPLIISIMKDGETFFETIRSYQEVSLSGFYLLPDKYLGSTITKSDAFSIYELTELDNLKYSNNKNNIRNAILRDTIVPKSIGRDTLKNDFWTNDVHMFTFDETVTQENLKNTMKNNFPNHSDIIDSIPTKMMGKVLNYNDFRKLMISYDIKYYDLIIEDRIKINGMIKKNISQYIKEYNSNVERKIIKTIEKRSKILTTKEKIDLIKEYINSIIVIPVRNNYIERFIERFSREPLDHETYEYLYEKNSDEKLICKHHLYSTKIKDDPDSFITLKNIYGGIAKDGIISCKVCGEYLCHEDYSTLEGFGDGSPNNSRAVLEEDETLKNLNEGQIKIKKLIHRITSLLSINLTPYDKQKIIDYFDLINNEELMDRRYSMNNVSKKHPQYKELKDKYKKLFVQPEKTTESKRKNKKIKAEYNNEQKSFQEYLINCNEVIVVTFLVLFHLQTSFPPYQIQTKELINLWRNEDIINDQIEISTQNIHTKISMDTIDNITILLDKSAGKYKKDNLWKNIKIFLNESKKYNKLPTFKNQFILTANYILQNSNINEKLREYIKVKNNVIYSVYLRENWSSYKPLPDTEIIQNINKIINQQLKDKDTQKLLLKKGTDIFYENLSSIMPITDAYDTPRHITLKIPFSSILRNESYKRLFEYSIHLHGKSKENKQINILIQNFINTIKDKDTERLLIQNGWDPINYRLVSIDYTKMKEIFFDKITEYFQNKTPEDKHTIELFKYININNWKGILLNGHSKRVYGYKQPVVIPNKSFTELLDTFVIPESNDDEKVTIIERLFKKYCRDDDGDIIETDTNDYFIQNLLEDTDLIQREKACNNKLEITEENFNELLQHRTKDTLLSDFKELLIESNFIEKRLYNFINYNQYLDYGGDDAYSIFEDIYNLNEIDDQEIKKEYRRVFNTIEGFKEKGIQKIKEFYERANEERILTTEQILNYKKLWVRFDKIDTYIDIYLNNSNNIENNITNMIYIIGRLSHSNNEVLGAILHDNIPKQWKLSETNITEIQKFMNQKEFLLHNDTFIDSHKYEGFYKYTKENDHLCFQGLFNFIKKSYKGGIHNLKGYDKSYYTMNYSKMFIRFMFIFLFTKLIDYIESLYDEQSVPSKQANELFKALEMEDEIRLSYSINTCTQLTFDLLIHFLSEYIDDGWIYQTELITDKLSKQKEREKQNLINDLESKTTESRAVTVEQQKFGIINWYKDSSEENLDIIKTDKYGDQLEEERINRIKEKMYEKSIEMEVSEANNISIIQRISNQSEGEKELDEGYSQIDNDREGEGDDDADEDGDYREN